MFTKLITVDPHQPDLEVIRDATKILRSGGLVAFPTETVYGLGANALDATAVEKIFAAKERPANNPLIVHTATVAAARELTSHWTEQAELLAARLWPGGLTMVLPKRDIIPDNVTAGGPTVAIRMPDHPIALALLHEAGIPVAAPSANRSNRLSPTTAQHVLKSMSDRIDLIIDGGPCLGGVESTVLDLCASPPRLLRPGLLPPSQIEAVIGPISRLPSPENDSARTISRSPGMLKKHYAPSAPLECIADSERRVRESLSQGLRVGWLVFGGFSGMEEEGLEMIVLPESPHEYAAQLYASLFHLDEAGVDRIFVELPPAIDEWLAVRDRLLRASER